MTDITIKLDREIHHRLRARAQQAGTTVPLLLADFVQTSALLLSDPEWNTPPRALLRRIAELHEHEASPQEIAASPVPARATSASAGTQVSMCTAAVSNGPAPTLL